MAEPRPHIDFSHQYTKMPPGVFNLENTTKVLQVFITDRKNLCSTFIHYDTHYKDENGNQNYPLPNGLVIVILLLTGERLWCTIRRHEPEKERYYRSLQGQQVDIRKTSSR